MNTEDKLTRIREDLLREAQSDFVGLWLVAKWMREELPRRESGRAKILTLELIARLLESGELYVGEFAGEIFEPWTLSATEAVARIDQDWEQLGRDPEIGEIAWFVHRDLLPASIDRHPMGKDWEPQ